MIALIPNADDFGASPAVNDAIMTAFSRGILRGASLMVTGAAWEDAVRLARGAPELEVGLHLVFLHGASVLPPSAIPELVNREGNFPDDPVAAGTRWYFSAAARRQIRMEVEAQVDRYLSTGLPLTHINGHLHFHIHPAIFDAVAEVAERRGGIPVRVPEEPLLPTLRIRRHPVAQKLLHAGVFRFLAARCRRALATRAVPSCDSLLGFFESGTLTEPYLLALLPTLPAGWHEWYAHPGAFNPHGDEGALFASKAIAALLEERRVRLAGWRELRDAKRPPIVQNSE